ncbi:MAG TPA: DUF1289 domain-containing protein [Gammaproteobacteria bacterium]
MIASDLPGATASPCVRNCCLDDDNVCIGCGRALAEIVGWARASEEEKRAILARAADRREQRRRRYGIP